MKKDVHYLMQDFENFLIEEKSEKKLLEFLQSLERMKEKAMEKLISITTNAEVLYDLATPLSKNPQQIRHIAKEKLRIVDPKMYRELERAADRRLCH